MEKLEVITELMQKIENMYFDKVIKGEFTNSGSFIAKNEDGKEFFVKKELAIRKSEFIEILVDNIRPLWVLVQDEIWSKKWNDKKVSSIKEISNTKEDCEVYKAKLLNQLQIKIKLIDLQNQILKLLDIPLDEANVKNIENLEAEISTLQNQLQTLNAELNDE